MEAAFLCPTRYRVVDSWLASGRWSRVSVIRVEIRKANSIIMAKCTADMLLDIEILASIRPVLDLLAKRL